MINIKVAQSLLLTLTQCHPLCLTKPLSDWRKVEKQDTQQPSVSALFKSFSIGSLTLPNRLVMAPMTRGFPPGGIPGADVAEYYRKRAENGVGLIITEGTLINHPAAGCSPNWPNFHTKEALEGWSKVVSTVHEAGGRIRDRYRY